MKKVIIGSLAIMLASAVAIGGAAVPQAKAAFSFSQGNMDMGDLFVFDKLFGNKNSSDIFGSGDETHLGDLFILDQLFNEQVAQAQPVSLGAQLSGRIVIQTEEQGQAWYIDPTRSNQRVALNGPNTAFQIMSNSSLGISNSDFNSIQGDVPARLEGRFLIKTEDQGQIYYANPVDDSLVKISGPGGAHSLVQMVGLGISNSDLNRIAIAQ